MYIHHIGIRPQNLCLRESYLDQGRFYSKKLQTSEKSPGQCLKIICSQINTVEANQSQKKREKMVKIQHEADQYLYSSSVAYELMTTCSVHDCHSNWFICFMI